MKDTSKHVNFLAGTPDWITPELIRETVDVWQPYYDEPLTDCDALEILTNVSRLADII